MTRSTRALWSSAVAVTAVVLAGATLVSAVPSITHEVVIDGDKVFMRSNYAEVGARANATFGSDTQQPTGWHGNFNFGGGTSLGFVTDPDRDGWDTGPVNGDFFTPGTPYEGWAIQVGSNAAKWNTNAQNDIAGAWTGSGTSPGAFVDWSASSPVDGVGVSMHYRMPSNGDPAIVTEATLTNTTGSDVEVIYARSLDADNCKTKASGCDTNGDGTADGGSTYSVLQSITAQRLDGDSITAIEGSQTDGSAITLWTSEPDSMAFSGAREEFCYTPPQLSAVLDLPLTYTPASPTNIANDCYTNYVYRGAFFNAPGTSKFLDDMMFVAARRLIPAGESVTMSLTYSMYSVDPALSVNVTAPTISGTVEAGSTLTADPGEWTNSPTGYAYQWLRCAADGTGCTPIDGATSSTYQATADDVGSTLRVSVLATNAAGDAAASVESSASSAVTAPETTTTEASPSTTTTLPSQQELPETGSGGPITSWLLVAVLLVAPGVAVRRLVRRSVN